MWNPSEKLAADIVSGCCKAWGVGIHSDALMACVPTCGRYYWRERCVELWGSSFCVHATELGVRRATWSARLSGSLGDGFGEFPFWSGSESTSVWRASLRTTSPAARMIAGLDCASLSYLTLPPRPQFPLVLLPIHECANSRNNGRMRADVMQRVLKEHHWEDLHPDRYHSFIRKPGAGDTYVSAALTRDHMLAILYFPARDAEALLKFSWFAESSVVGRWISPSTGVVIAEALFDDSSPFLTVGPALQLVEPSIEDVILVLTSVHPPSPPSQPPPPSPPPPPPSPSPTPPIPAASAHPPSLNNPPSPLQSSSSSRKQKMLTTRIMASGTIAGALVAVMIVASVGFVCFRVARKRIGSLVPYSKGSTSSHFAEDFMNDHPHERDRATTMPARFGARAIEVVPVQLEMARAADEERAHRADAAQEESITVERSSRILGDSAVPEAEAENEPAEVESEFRV